MTLTEKRLWDELRKLKLHVRRQAPIGRYIADFIHHGAQIVFEIDSAWHDFSDRQLRDAERDQWLRSQGYRVVRIKDGEVLNDPAGIAERVGSLIERTLAARRRPPPLPLNGEGAGDGVEAPALAQQTPIGASANLSVAPKDQATTPTPAPPPLRGRGSRA